MYMDYHALIVVGATITLTFLALYIHVYGLSCVDCHRCDNHLTFLTLYIHVYGLSCIDCLRCDTRAANWILSSPFGSRNTIHLHTQYRFVFAKLTKTDESLIPCLWHECQFKNLPWSEFTEMNERWFDPFLLDLFTHWLSYQGM